MKSIWSTSPRCVPSNFSGVWVKLEVFTLKAFIRIPRIRETRIWWQVASSYLPWISELSEVALWEVLLPFRWALSTWMRLVSNHGMCSTARVGTKTTHMFVCICWCLLVSCWLFLSGWRSLDSNDVVECFSWDSGWIRGMYSNESMPVVHWCMWCLDKNLYDDHGNCIQRVKNLFSALMFFGFVSFLCIPTAH